MSQHFSPGDEVLYTNWNGFTQVGKVVADPAPGMPNDAFVDFDWGGTLADRDYSPVPRRQLTRTPVQSEH